MNTTITVLSNTWTALVFGAVFNLLAASPDETLIAYAIKTVIGGVIWLAFQLLADRIKNNNAKKKKESEHENNEEQKS